MMALRRKEGQAGLSAGSTPMTHSSGAAMIGFGPTNARSGPRPELERSAGSGGPARAGVRTARSVSQANTHSMALETTRGRAGAAREPRSGGPIQVVRAPYLTLARRDNKTTNLFAWKHKCMSDRSQAQETPSSGRRKDKKWALHTPKARSLDCVCECRQAQRRPQSRLGARARTHKHTRTQVAAPSAIETRRERRRRRSHSACRNQLAWAASCALAVGWRQVQLSAAAAPRLASEPASGWPVRSLDGSVASANQLASANIV